MSFFKILLFITILILILVLAFTFKINKVFESFTNDNIAKNIILIGDSILNNSVYVFEKQSVYELIQEQIQKDKRNIKCYNFAKDGALISNCHSQILNSGLELDSNSTIFVSAGGNNILHSFIKNGAFIENLFSEYLQLIDDIKVKHPTANIVALNLYYPLKPSLKLLHPLIKQWNQLISDNSSKKGYKIIKLDEIIVSDEDIIYDVEPSFKGGQKITTAILAKV